jgi:hypothetical protein
LKTLPFPDTHFLPRQTQLIDPAALKVLCLMTNPSGTVTREMGFGIGKKKFRRIAVSF